MPWSIANIKDFLMCEGVESVQAICWSKTCLKNYSFEWTIVWKTIKIGTFLFFFVILIAKEVFEDVHFGFLVVGHTHKDIDGSFGYLSKKQNNYLLIDLMKAFMVPQELFIPQLI